MKYLITGGLGFLGHALSQEVLKRGDELSILDNCSSTHANLHHEQLEKEGAITLFKADIRNSDDVNYIIEKSKPDVIFHLAFNNSILASQERPKLDFEINVMGTVNLLEAIRKFCPQTPLLTSSSHLVYGALDHCHYEESDDRFLNLDFPDGISESEPTSPRSPLGCSKAALEQYVMEYARSYKLQTVVFRHAPVFGTGGDSVFYQLLKDALEIKSGARLHPVAIMGSGKQVIDLFFISDFVKAYFKASANMIRAAGEVFNIGPGKQSALSLVEFIQLLQKELKITIETQQLPWKSGSQRSFIANIQKAKEKIHFTPSVDTSSAIRFVIEQYLPKV